MIPAIAAAVAIVFGVSTQHGYLYTQHTSAVFNPPGSSDVWVIESSTPSLVTAGQVHAPECLDAQCIPDEERN